MNSSLRCKQQEIWGPDWLRAWTYLNNITQLSVLFQGIGSIKVVFTSQHAQLRTLPKKVQKQERKIIKNEMRCRNDVPKSTRTRKDRSDGKYTKPNSYICCFVKRCRDEALYIYHHFYPFLFVHFLTRHSYISFHF